MLCPLMYYEIHRLHQQPGGRYLVPHFFVDDVVPMLPGLYCLFLSGHDWCRGIPSTNMGSGVVDTVNVFVKEKRSEFQGCAALQYLCTHIGDPVQYRCYHLLLVVIH